MHVSKERPTDDVGKHHTVWPSHDHVLNEGLNPSVGTIDMQCTKFNTNNKNKRHISEIKIQLSEDSSKTQSLKKINKQLQWENVKEMKMIKLTVIQN